MHEPAHEAHPLQALHVHLELHGCGRELHHSRRHTPWVVVVLGSTSNMRLDGDEKAVALVLGSEYDVKIKCTF